MATATVNYRAELSDLRKKLASITDITAAEARKMASDLNKSMRAIERSNKKAVVSFKGVGDSAGDAESSIRAISGAIGMVNPQAEKALNVFAELGGATEGITRGAQVLGATTMRTLAVGLAAVTAAAVAGYGVWSIYAAEMERARRTQELSARTAETLRNRSEALITTTTDLRVAVGELTAKEAKLLTLRRRMLLESLPAMQEITQAITEQEAHVRKLEQATKSQADGGNLVANAYMMQAGASSQVNKNLEKERENLASLEADRTALLASLKKQSDAQEALVDAQDKADRQRSASRRGDADELKMLREREAASERLAQITASASLSALKGEARLTEEYRRQLAQIAELEKASGDRINADEARAAVQVRHEQQIAELRERNAAAAASREKRRAEDVERARQAAMAQSLDVAGMVAGGISSAVSASYGVMMEEAIRLQDFQTAAGEHLTKAQQKELDRRVSAQKRAARNAFQAGQAAAAAEAAVQTALAVSKALGSAPPPFNFVLAGTALAAGVAQEAAIARQQPSFHRGGPVDLAPDEVAATVRRSEFVLNPTGRAMMGDVDLTRANAGQSARGGEVVAVSVYKHTRQVDRWKRDGLNAGDPIARAIDSGKLIGHRSNR